MNGPLYIAVDLGAGSGRVFLAGVDPDEFLLEEVHRFRYPPRSDGEFLRWDFATIFAEIKSGLRLAASRARDLGRTVKSLGVDSWAVDYGLVDSAGKLVADPICYRDSRTDAAIEKVFRTVPQHEIFERTGIQFQKFNTVYQLSANGNDFENSSKLLLLPDLINFFLSGVAVTEYTNATTTQMVNAVTGNWDSDLMDRLNLPRQLLQNIVPAGTRLGPIKPDIAAELGLEGVEVIASATHDTASAVAAAPLSKDRAFVSSGTWSLIGVELAKPLINRDVSRLNFTNEGGAFGTIRFLKNVMGLWIFESCRNEWEAAGISVEYDSLISKVGAINGFKGFIFPDDERFLNPASMLEAIRNQLTETGQETPVEPVEIAKIIFDSLAFRYASVLRSIESVTGLTLTGIEILGGGGRNRYLNQMTANASGLLVRSGLSEATVVGNVLVQAVTSGRFNSLTEARSYVEENVEFEDFVPDHPSSLTDAADKYAEVEDRFTTQLSFVRDQ